MDHVLFKLQFLLASSICNWTGWAVNLNWRAMPGAEHPATHGGRCSGGSSQGVRRAGCVRGVGGVRVVPASQPPLPARRPTALRLLVPRPHRE